MMQKASLGRLLTSPSSKERESETHSCNSCHVGSQICIPQDQSPTTARDNVSGTSFLAVIIFLGCVQVPEASCLDSNISKNAIGVH